MEAMCECGCTFVCAQAGRFPKMKIDEYARGNVFNNLFLLLLLLLLFMAVELARKTRGASEMYMVN